MAPVKLYVYYVSQPARACSWAVLANNAADKVDIIPVDLAKGEHRTPEFLAMNPYHTVPTLKDEETGVILYESGAILQYLAEKFNWTNVTIPKDDVVTRAKAINYLHFHHTHARKQLGNEVFMSYAKPAFVPGATVDRDAIAKGLKKAEDEWLGPFDKSIGENGGYIAGNYPTFADLHAFTELSFYLPNKYGFGLYAFDKYPNIQAWLEKMPKVEGFEKAFEGIPEFVSYAKAKAGDA